MSVTQPESAAVAKLQGTQDPGELWHISLNNDASETIILLHGLGTCYAEWMLVWPHLTSYHLLIPDLNGHRNSSTITPFTIDAQAARVAALIRTHAHGGKAHIVGLSMGGFVAVSTARSYPDIARCVFATGCAPFEGWRQWMATSPNLIGASMGLSNLLPKWMNDRWEGLSAAVQGITIPEELHEGAATNKSPKLFKDVFGDIACQGADMLKDVKVRTLAVAGGKMDNVPATAKQGQLLKEGCGMSRAVVVRKGGHAWNLQFPELFAEGVLAWIEERPLPGEFEELV